MNKKLYTQLLLAVLVSSYAVAIDYTKAIGRTLNGNETAFNSSLELEAPQKISFSDAKDLKKQMKDISKDVSSLSAAKKQEVQAKVFKLADLIKKNKVVSKK